MKCPESVGIGTEEKQKRREVSRKSSNQASRGEPKAILDMIASSGLIAAGVGISIRNEEERIIARS
ncbi:hypothetical protein SAMN05421736_11132 [Evansella caseinilytica]|uniref:Uncharacterized protein n=1 Tax=Evansella caseinilytica TaxID=1503961 RepID=A0A1H3SIA1_9BACI|nr:hypothetical protein [Evansella caseinilytica]SDZ37664.1 hypothetical protein SAMN05421736_11132 [Evansella caseinilytica]